MKPTIEVIERALRVVCLVMFFSSAGFAQQNSLARVVRLSFAEGTVTVQRPDADEWSTAPVNTPIQEGFTLATADNSFAEIQFERALSTVRIGQLSELEFTQLELSPTGGHINRMTLNRGYATFHALPSAEDVYEVKVADGTFTAHGKAEFRVDMDEGGVRVEVFKGEVGFAGSEGEETLSKNTVLVFTPASADPYDITQGVTPDDWDQWVKQRDEVVSSADAAPSGVYSAGAEANSYGWSDLNNYGNWNTIPGYGWCWFPAVSYGWSPYSVGRWSWYPSFGYTWIASEPWGWLPYHYGNWLFDATTGWFWIPGSMAGWQPALVTWYQGPGWVGWVPRAASVHGSPNCQVGRTCVTAINNEILRDGRVITPKETYSVDLIAAHGQPVQKPDINPGHLALLPGAPADRPSFIARQPGRPVARPSVASDRSSYAGAAAPAASGGANPRYPAPTASAGRPAPSTAEVDRSPRTGIGQRRPGPSSTEAWTGARSGVRSSETGAAAPRSSASGSWANPSSSTGSSGASRSSGSSGSSGSSRGYSGAAGNSGAGGGSSHSSGGGGGFGSGGGGGSHGGGGGGGGGSSPGGGHR